MHENSGKGELVWRPFNRNFTLPRHLQVAASNIIKLIRDFCAALTQICRPLSE